MRTRSIFGLAALMTTIALGGCSVPHIVNVEAHANPCGIGAGVNFLGNGSEGCIPDGGYVSADFDHRSEAPHYEVKGYGTPNARPAGSYPCVVNGQRGRCLDNQ